MSHSNPRGCFSARAPNLFETLYVRVSVFLLTKTKMKMKTKR